MTTATEQTTLKEVKALQTDLTNELLRVRDNIHKGNYDASFGFTGRDILLMQENLLRGIICALHKV